MTNFVIRNQTPQHVELHGPAGELRLSPLQRRRLGHDPRSLYHDAAVEARRDQVVDWSPEPNRGTVLRVASLCTSVGMITAVVAAGALVRRHLALGLATAGIAAVTLVTAVAAIHLGQDALVSRAPERDKEDKESEPDQPTTSFTELARDLLLSTVQCSALVLLIAVGVAAPGVALYFGTDLSDFLDVSGGHVTITDGAEAHHVLVVRSLQLVLVILVSLVPALMYYQFDREKLSTLVDRWLHVIFRLDPTLRTIADVDAKYGRRVEEFLGATLGVGQEPTTKRLRDRSSVVLSTLLIAIGWIIVMLSVPATGKTGAVASVAEMFHPLLTPVTMAFLGAYFLSVQVVLRGFVRGDLKTKTYNVITVRILMAVILAWALEAIAGDNEAVLALSFLGGLVPNTVLLQIRNLSGSKATSDVELDRRSPLTQIDEIDVYERTRLEEEGITSVQALARHDLVDLMLSSRIPAPRLIDWVDQAMLQQHTTAEITLLLRNNGVRSATDLLKVCQDKEALTELNTAMKGTCSPHLLRVVLDHDEWLSYIMNCRENQYAKPGAPLVYGVPALDIDLRDTPAPRDKKRALA
ncbi:MAG: hypothetical protein QOE58_3456 [Actinomycetota bacterium]|nr:hypothetical protein [Actinomycetota bacterium]